MVGKKAPNFILGGTSAGGTSFLSAILVQHPEIYLPKKMRPEPHFFYKSWEYEKGLDYYLSKWFNQVPEHSLAIGERSSSYLFGGAKVARKIASHFPKTKLIFTLRDPSERAWANYRYTVLQGLENLSFEEALRDESQRIRTQTGIWAEIQPYNYTGRSFYGQQIKDFYKYFKKENVLLLKSELLSSETDKQLRKVYSFLGLNELDFKHKKVPNYTSVDVINPELQMKLRQYFGSRFDLIIEAIRKEKDIKSFIKSKPDQQNINKLVSNMMEKKNIISASTKGYLKDLFREDVNQLKEIVDFDISEWA